MWDTLFAFIRLLRAATQEQAGLYNIVEKPHLKPLTQQLVLDFAEYRQAQVAQQRAIALEGWGESSGL